MDGLGPSSGESLWASGWYDAAPYVRARTMNMNSALQTKLSAASTALSYVRVCCACCLRCRLRGTANEQQHYMQSVQQLAEPQEGCQFQADTANTGQVQAVRSCCRGEGQTHGTEGAKTSLQLSSSNSGLLRASSNSP